MITEVGNIKDFMDRNKKTKVLNDAAKTLML